MIEPRQLVPTVQAENALERLNRCRAMLYLHKFITEPESNRIRQRILKWLKESQESEGVK
jgi:hypothetical protein